MKRITSGSLPLPPCWWRFRLAMLVRSPIHGLRRSIWARRLR